MKFSILDVPEQFANRKSTEGRGGETQYVINPVPATQPSVHTSSEDAHQLLKDLAIQDGWGALYDPTDANSLIYESGKLVGLKDSLGNYPDLKVAPLPPIFGGGDTEAFLHSQGAVKIIDGIMGSNVAPPSPTISTTSLIILPPLDPEEGGASQVVGPSGVVADNLFEGVSESSPRCLVGINHIPGAPPGSGGALLLSSGVESSVASRTVAVDGSQVVSFESHSGRAFQGYREVDLDGISEEDIEDFVVTEPLSGVSFGSFFRAWLGDDPNFTGGFGPVFVANGTSTDEARNRAVSLIAKLSGALVGFPPGTPDEPDAYLVSDEDGNYLVGHKPLKVDLLASVVKVLTCFVAKRDFVNDNVLDDLIELKDPYASSNAPDVEDGDKVSWRDAFYASMHRSHNYITQNIAYHCGLMIDPQSQDPRAEFMSYVQDIADGWGWFGADLPNAQGGSSKAAPYQVNELMFRTRDEVPWLYQIMGEKDHTYTIYRQGQSPGEELEFNSLTTPTVSGELLFPELIAAKSGSLAVTKTSLATWFSPVQDKVFASYIARTPDNTAAGRWRSQRNLWDAVRTLQPPPQGYSPSESTDLTWGADEVRNFVILTRKNGYEGQPLQVDPLAETVRPVVQAGDEVTIQFRAQSGGFPGVIVDAKIPGGSFRDSPFPWTTGTASPPSWALRTVSATVSSGGYLNLTISTGAGGADNPWVRFRDVTVSVERNDREIFRYELDVTNFSVTESSQPHDSNDSSGSVGEFSVEVEKPLHQSIFSEYGHGFVRNKPVELLTTYGKLRGTVNSVDMSNGHHISLSGVSEMGPLNSYNVVAPPFSGTLTRLLETYFSLIATAAPEFTIDPSLESRQITVPGWKGELWYHLKLLCAAERIQISLNPGGGVHVSPSGGHTLFQVPVTQLGVTFQEVGLAEAVEVYRYNNKWVEESLIYPPGGWTEETEVLSVNAGEIAEQTLDLSASLISFKEPQMVEHVSKTQDDSSVYTIVGDDGFPVKPRQWEEGGGQVEFRLGEDTRTIEVTMIGATGIQNDQGEEMRSFSLALASDTSGSRYSTLRITGTGVTFNRELIRIPTGVPSDRTGTEIGATIDNPFLSSMGQAVQAGTLAAYKFSGASPELSHTSLGPHVGKWGTEVLSGVLESDIANYRVREVTYTPEGANATGDYFLTYADMEEGFEGTYAQYESRYEGQTYQEAQARGKK